MSLKLVPFESLDADSYSPSIVTVAVSVAVCEIFSVKKWCDLENQVRGRSRSLKMAPFSYDERLSRLHLHSLELRRLLTDLVWCYKILKRHVIGICYRVVM